MQNFRSTAALIRERAPEEPVYCLRPSRIADNATRFIEGFPGTVLFAVKSNPLPEVLDILYGAGIRHFDTASTDEIVLVRGRYADARAYFMHPVKGEQAMHDASQRHAVRHFVVDHQDELHKLCRVFPAGGVVPVVRMATPPGARFDLSEKFGADATASVALMRAAETAGLRPGLCFHVGSQCLDPRLFETAFALAGEVLRESGVAPVCLDVGGGFPARYPGAAVPALDEFLVAVRAGLRSLSLPGDCQVMCEPGRALVADGISVLTRVMLRKGNRLYLNDGIYGSFKGCTIGLRFPYRVLRGVDGLVRGDALFTVFGPTCDSLDVLPEPLALPADISTGDWIEFGCMGAYSAALRTGFNGFYPRDLVTVEEPFPEAGEELSATPAPSMLQTAV